MMNIKVLEMHGSADLHLNGKASDHIWMMEDGEAPHIIGIRVDCGDSGTLYVTYEQALDLAKQLVSCVKNGWKSNYNVICEIEP